MSKMTITRNTGSNNLLDEVFEQESFARNSKLEICGQLALLWLKPSQNSHGTFMHLLALISKKFDWECFEPGSIPLIAVYFGSIYSYKELVFEQTQQNEADALVFGATTKEALESLITLIRALELENFIKLEFSETVIEKVLAILPLSGLLSYDNWIEPAPMQDDYETRDRRLEAIYGLYIKRPRDTVEADLFAASLQELDSLRLVLRTIARRQNKRSGSVEGVRRCWEFLRYARELLNARAVNEAGLVAVAALEELLIYTSGVSYDSAKRDRLIIGKIISLVERNKNLSCTQTKVLRDFASLRPRCAHAISTGPRAVENLAPEIDDLIEWLESYPEWLR